MVKIPVIEDPIDERTTAEQISGYGGDYVPDLPDIKADRFAQYGVGNIPYYQLSQWEQREVKTGQNYTDYIGEIKVQEKVRIAEEAEIRYEKQKLYLESLGGPGDIAYDSYMKKLEFDRIERMSNFEEEYGWSYEDTLAFARKEGPKYEHFLAMGGESRPGARAYWEQSQNKVTAAESVLWQNAEAIAITRLGDTRPRDPEGNLVDPTELSQYQKFRQDKFDWYWQRSYGAPWEGNLQTMMLSSSIEFTGPVTRMTLDEYRQAGAFKPGDEFDWQTARLYGVMLSEGETLRVNPAQDITYSVVTEDPDTGLFSEREINITEYEIWDVGEPRFADYEKLIQLGFEENKLTGLENDTFTVVKNENGMFQILFRKSGPWTFNVADGSAILDTPEGPIDYSSTQMAELENKQAITLDVTNQFYPEIQGLINEMSSYIYELEPFDITAMDGTRDIITTDAQLPQTSEEFMVWAGKEVSGELVNLPTLVDLFRAYGDTPETRQFLRNFYGMKDTAEEYEVTGEEGIPISIDEVFHNPDIIDWIKKWGATAFWYGAAGAMESLEGIGQIVDIPGKMFAIPLVLTSCYINEAGFTDKFGFTASEKSLEYIKAFEASTTWTNPTGYMDNPELLELYHELLPGKGGWVLRTATESIPWIPLTLGGLAATAALRTARLWMLPLQETATVFAAGRGMISVPRLLAGSLRFTRASMRGPVMFDTAANAIIRTGLKGAVGVGLTPFRVGHFGMQTLKWAGGNVKSSQVIISGIQIFVGKGIGVWASQRMLAPHMTNRLMLLLRNQYRGPLDKIIQEGIFEAGVKLEAQGLTKAQAAGRMAAEAANIILDKLTVKGGLLSKLEGLAKSIPSKSVPLTEEAAATQLAMEGYTMTKADIITKANTVMGQASQRVKYILQRGGEVVEARNLQEVTNFINSNSTTGMIGGHDAQVMGSLINKLGGLTADDIWIYQRISHQIPGNSLARSMVQYNKGLRPSNVQRGVVLNAEEYMERALMGEDPLDEFIKAEWREFVDSGARSPLALAIGKARATIIGAGKRGNPIDAERKSFDVFIADLPDQAAFDSKVVGEALELGVIREEQALVTAVERQLVIDDLMRGGAEVAEGITKDVPSFITAARPDTPYDEVLKAHNWLTSSIKNLESWVGMERPSTKSYFSQQLKKYQQQLEELDETLVKIAENKTLTKKDTFNLNVALGPGSSKEPGMLKDLLRNQGLLVEHEFFDYQFQDITAANAAFSTPRDAFKFIDNGTFGAKAQEEIFFPINNMRDVLKESGIVLRGRLTCIMDDMGLAGPLNARYRKDVLFDVLEQLSSKQAGRDVASLLKNNKIAGVFKAHNVPDENMEPIVKAATEIRDMLDELILRSNKVRALLGRDAVGYQKNYMMNIRVGAFSYRMQKYLHGAGDADWREATKLDGTLGDLLSIPNQRRWARDMERAGLMEDWAKNKNVYDLVSMYIEGANKDIYFTPFIQSNKLHSQAWRTMGLEGNANFLDQYTAETLLGFEGTFDRVITSLTTKKGMSWVGFTRNRMYDLRYAMNTAVLPGNIPWSMFIQTSSTALNVKHIGIKNTIQGYWEWFFNVNGCRDTIKQWSTVYRIKAGGTRGSGSVIHADILAQEGTNVFRFAPRDAVNYYTNFIMRTFEGHLTGGSVRGGYLKGTQLGYTGGKRWAYASDVGAKTQSMYNKDDIPAIMRNRILGTSFPFQTFAFEMFNAARELTAISVFRTGAYKTIAANSPEGQAVLWQRMLSIGEWMASMAAVNEVVSRSIGRDPYTLASMFPFYNYIVGGALLNDPWAQPLWAKFARDVTQAIFVDIYRYGNWDPLKDVILRYLFPAGVQINRFIEGMFAMVNHEVTDKKGFPVFDDINSTDPTNVAYALLCGPWRTKEGQEYIEAKFKEQGMFEKYTGIPWFTDKVWDPPTEEKIATDKLGSVQENNYGVMELYTTKSWASDILLAYEKTGPNKVHTFLPWGREVIEFANSEAYMEFKNTHGFDPVTGLRDQKETTRLKNNLIDGNGEIDAFEYLFGGRTGLRTAAGLDAVDRWIKKYQIPLEAIEGWDEIDQVQLRFATDNRQWIAGYYKDNSTYEGRDNYFGRDPDGARRWFTNEARKDGVPEELQDVYASYYMAGYESLRETKYDDEWLLMEDIEYNNAEFITWLYKNERLTPPFEVWRYPQSPRLDGGSEWKMYQQYEAAVSPDAKRLLRCQSQVMDDLMVRLRGGEMKPCYGTDSCRNLINAQKEVSPYASEAEGGVHFAEYE